MPSVITCTQRTRVILQITPTDLFTTGAGFSTHFAAIFTPFASEYDLIGKHPDAAHTVRNVTKFEATMDELRQAISPELELIESRIVGPIKEFQAVMKLIRKTITKRDHKVFPLFQ